ncbi:valine--tRNA ligase [Patescibacteria group bacterium]|nr:valine--tRNA ligase [Patescibacteria group bacterium]MBU2233917.1 valine--tRNA ligase [Patescibacteria group bacterium]
MTNKFETGQNMPNNNKKNGKEQPQRNTDEIVVEEKEKDKIEKKTAKEYYDFQAKEKYWQNFWEREKVYEFDPNSPKPLFTIDTPPPTISGPLHLGHIYSYTQAEVISRFKRMAGLNVRYPFGLDNNGLPTERLVEKEKGIRGRSSDLAQFTKTCLEVTEHYRHIYEELWKSIGLGVDWRLEYSTISPEVQKISQIAFKELFDKGLIYKKESPALFCTECQTSVAQAEVEYKEKDSVFYDLKFKMEDGRPLTISTTRPELLPACVAVFVHPDDERYKTYIGEKIITPLGNSVEIIADEKVSIEKGTGVVMCCTYGDETDASWVKKYSLPEKVILDKNGLFLNSAVEELRNKNIKQGREEIINLLQEKKSLLGSKPIKHDVGVHERCGTPIEILSTPQWFVKLLDAKNNLLEMVEKINWHPPHMRKRFEEWVKNLKWDWCISRERFYGTPIPAFSCDKCDTISVAEESEMPIDPKKSIERPCKMCDDGKLLPEKDVLDTWFTSSLTPDINAASQYNGNIGNKMLPMSMRPQAHDIIRTWAVYTMLMSHYKHNDIPWKELMISGHILLRKGEKISKKTGGGKLKPEEMIATYSADATRYAMCGASLGRDAYYDEGEVEKGKKLITKLYNAGKLVLGNLDRFKFDFDKKNLEPIDKWIILKSQIAASEMADAFNNYEFGKARQIFEDFFWREYCDNYLEIIKGRVRSTSVDDETKRQSAQYALYQSFLNILKMSSPFVPHIAEEVYHGNFGEGAEKSFISDAGSGIFLQHESSKSIHLLGWPTTWEELKSDSDQILGSSSYVLEIISKVRQYKTQNKIKMVAPVSIKIMCSADLQNQLSGYIDDLKNVTKAESIVFEQIDDKENVEQNKLKVEINHN